MAQKNVPKYATLTVDQALQWTDNLRSSGIHMTCMWRLRAAGQRVCRWAGRELIGLDSAIRHHQTRDLISNASITTTSCSFSLALHSRRSTTDGLASWVPCHPPYVPLTTLSTCVSRPLSHHLPRRVCSTS